MAKKSKIEKTEEKMGAEPEDMMESEEPQEHEIEHAAETLMKAEHIKKNGKMMKHVHKHLKKKKSAIDSIADLRKKADKMFNPEE